jgi:hypothetical protein
MRGQPHGQTEAFRSGSAFRLTFLLLLLCHNYTFVLQAAAEVQVVTAADASDVRRHAEQSFNEPNRHGDQQAAAISDVAPPQALLDHAYPSQHYWVGKGQGDLAKGRLVCQRVSELSARTDLAKQIRVMVKEHMIDRVRERSGRDTDQDIELTREEVVQEYLSGVTIVDRQIDEENKICTATAVMLKGPIQPRQPADTGTAPASSR